jgi:hypothetical protein
VWRDELRAEFLHSASTTADAAAFAQKLLWMGQRIVPAALHETWTGTMHATWLQRCKECTEWGTKQDYFHENIMESTRWADCVVALKSAPDKVSSAQGTVTALISALDKDAICHQALAVLPSGGRSDIDAARSSAAKEREAHLKRARAIIGGDSAAAAAVVSPKRPTTVAARAAGAAAATAAATAAVAAAPAGGDGAGSSRRSGGVAGNKRGSKTGTTERGEACRCRLTVS